MSELKAGKYLAYPEYRDSKIGWLERVPSHWIEGSVKYICKSLDYKRIPLSAEERGSRQGEYPYYGASGVIDRVDDYLFDEDTILFGEDGANLLAKSTPLAFFASGKYWVNNHAHILKPLDEMYSFWVNSLNNLDISPVVSGSAQPKLTAEALGNLKVVYPQNVEERQKIASFLDHETAKIDTLIEKQQQLIKLLKEKRQAVISHAVTKGLNPQARMKDSGVEWLGEVPEHWVVKPMNMASSKLAVGLATSVTNYYRDSGATIIRNLNIKQGYFDGSDMLYIDESFALKEKSKVTKYGDVLMVRTGSNIGLACTTPKEFDNCHTFTTLIITPSQELNADYLTCCINSAYGKSEVQKLKQGFGKDNLNVEELRRFQVIVPPITEQIKIVSYLNEQNKKIDELLIECSKAISLMQERRSALISAAVTGKIDVRHWEQLND